MLRMVLLMAATVVSAIFAAPVWPQQAVFIVRHAERVDGSLDSPLSQAGQARAAHLAQMLSVSRISAIFVTRLRRTAQTAGPLARTLRVKPTVVAGTIELVEAVRAQPSEKNVLIVGHGNTIPQILEGLGYKGVPGVDFDEYDNLLVLVTRPDGHPVLLRLKY